MGHSIIIETPSDKDFALFKELAERLGLRTHETYDVPTLDKAEEKALFEEVAGSWQGDETGDELAEFLRKSRNDSPRSIQL
ncbi:nitroreductase family protein [Arundinibacter roseus]|uniref:Uncharacterized protein n=1 Tax=Arundinibacter roseus TaxID=2070510 RepID=A0A4R4K7W1_9BACT|nr:hypothetical protein [Arundinibacter roseus]TDB63744.1 hypothetical protein EZE20_15735 [Arundinibacter roseus]